MTGQFKNRQDEDSELTRKLFVERATFHKLHTHSWSGLITVGMTTTINSNPEMVAHRSSKVSVPVLGVGDKIGEGDTYLVENVLPPELADEVVFDKLMKEVAWNVMHHRGSLALPIIPIARQDTQRHP